MEIQKSLQVNTKNPSLIINNDYRVGDTELIVNNSSFLRKNEQHSPHDNGSLKVLTSPRVSYVQDNSTTMGGQHSAYIRTSQEEDESPGKYNIRVVGGSSPREVAAGQGVEEDDVFTRYYRHKIWFLLLIRSCCIASVISVCMNTPKTFKRHPWLNYATLIIDIVTGFILTGEAFIKIRSKGFLRNQKAYIRSTGRILEFINVICINISVVLQILEITINLDEKVSEYIFISWVRVPRPLLLLRVIKSILNLSLPKTVSPRSLKQIWGVLLFTFYFMTLAALIGVQTFGLMKYYCVKSNALVNETKYDDFLIPATRCSQNNLHKDSFQCPNGFACKKLEFKKFRQQRQYFEYILPGLLTVYEATSMEGWSFVMYDTMDTRNLLFGVLYFICLIFFISLLVRNVFIAIVTEAFADLRVQVSKYSTRSKAKEEQYHVLRKLESDNTMSLVKEDHITTSSSRVAVYNFVHWKGFIYFMYLCVLVDAGFQSFFSDFKYTGHVQIVFTMLFNAEALLKIYGMGLRHYWSSHPCRFEAVLCIGSTAFLAPVFMKRNGFAVFQVLRPFRLILLWGALTTFLKRILGSGKKITSLVLFTLSSLVIASGITLQLFCGFGLKEKDFDFDMFPQAMRAIFQVFMAEAWNEVMDKVLYVGGQKVAFLVFLVFILFHMLAALILVSVFVALILDNLELSEELKIAKQRRIGEEVVGTQKELPRRIRFYDHLKPRPKVVNMEATDGNLPKVRQSFVSRFISSATDMDGDVPLITDISSVSMKLTETPGENNDALQLSFVENQPKDYHFSSHFRKQSSVTALIQEAHIKRMSIFSHGTESVTRKTTPKTLRRGNAQSPSLGSKHSRISSNGSTAPRGVHPTLGVRLTNASSVWSQQEQKDRNRKQKRDRGNKDIDVGLVRQKLEEAQRRKELLIESLRENHPKFDESLFIFSANNTVRKFIHKIVHARYDKFTRDERGAQIGAFSIDRFKRYWGTQTYLDWIMLLLTQISCLSMLAETPSHRTFDNYWLSGIEYTFVISTSIELTLKIIADGLFFAPNAFIRDFGSVLHVFIYIVSLVFVCWHPTVISPRSVAQVLLVLRALRPLRIITLAPQLRKVVWVLVSGYTDMIKVAILQGVLMFVFASYGVQTLGGRLKACNDATIPTEELCVGTFNITLASPKAIKDLSGAQAKMLVPRVWRNPRNFNFDDMASAFLALFEVISLEGWTDVRDIINQQVDWTASLYPHFYVFFAALIGLTLFIGVIVSSFNENKGIALLTVEQKRWKDLKKKLELAQPLHLPSRPLQGSLRAKLYEIFVGRAYNRFYAVVVLLNCGTLCIGQWSPTDVDVASDKLYQSAIYISIICCLYFTVETVLKIYAFSFNGYMLSWRNRADFILMLGGVVFSLWTIFSCHISATKNHSCSESMLLGVAVFVLRFLSLSGKHNGLRMLMLTVVMSLTKSFYTISVLLMIMACYAFTGVILFGKVKHGISLNKTANFDTSWNSLLLLFRILTGEDWNKVMHDAMLSPPYCEMFDDKDYRYSNCGNRWGALIFFHSYYLIISYIFLNLFIAVVIENFSIFYSTDDDPIMSQQDIAHFQETWNLADSDKTGSVSIRRAKFIVRLLRGGLELEKQKNANVLHFKRLIAEIEKKSNGKNVTFHNLLFILAYKKIDVSKSLLLEERLEREEADYTILEEVAKETIRHWVKMVMKKRRGMLSGKRKRLERRLSVNSGLSVPSMDSQHSELDDINPSLHSGVIYPPGPVQYATGVYNHDASIMGSGLEVSGLRRRKGDDRKEYKSEIYSWWDDEVEDNQP